MTFVSRQIKLSIALAQNTQTNQPSTFSESGTNQVNISGLRTKVQIRNAGAPTNCSATVQIYGLTPSLMNQLSTLGLVLNVVPKNIITIQAGDAMAGFSTVFQGTIWGAYGDYQGQPDVPFIMECLLSGANNITQMNPTSFPGSFDVAGAMQTIAGQISAPFKNNGISIKLPKMYIAGSPLVQAQKIADAANINWGFPDGSTMEIWAKNGSRTGGQMPTISPQTGMIGYPAFTQQGIVVKTLFNPQIQFGSMIQVNSSVLSAIAQVQSQKGNDFPTQWAVNKVDLDLDAQVPKGQWMTTAYAYSPGKSNLVLPPATS